VRNRKNVKSRSLKREKQEKGEYGFIGWLIGGLILILIGFFALLQFAGFMTSGMSWAIVLLIIGVVFIIAAVYYTTTARKRSPSP
jgi:VIT1/CCC1 family predicted Fe2+/Mn2+ transporter